MPFYSKECEECGFEGEYLVQMSERETPTPCKVCGAPSHYKASYKTVALGLPNGHIGIRNKSRSGSNRQGGADNV